MRNIRRRLRRFALVAPVLAASLLRSVPAEASGCVVSADAVAFGGYSVFDPQPTATAGTIRYTCTQPVEPPVIHLSAGHASSFAPRKMASTADSLDYNLFLDASCTTVWGDGTAGTSAYSGAAPLSGQGYEVTVYGCIPERQNVRAGSYSDAIVVTILF